MRLLIFLASLLLPLSVQAYRYMTPIEHSRWEAEGNRLICRLKHQVEAYGEAQFIHEAGNLQRLLLDGDGYLFSLKTLRVISDPPVWRPERSQIPMPDIKPKMAPVILRGKPAMDLLEELTGGMHIAFMGVHRDADKEPFIVYLSTVGLKAPYAEFQRCESGLFSANFAQLERSRVQYSTAESDISVQAKVLLDHIAEYLTIDLEVKQIFVDGHTDDAGTNRDNVTLSEARAAKVRDYLLAAGVASTKITMRYHGEKYPVVKNNSAKNKAKNRRTTLRLSKEQIQDQIQDQKPELN